MKQSWLSLMLIICSFLTAQGQIAPGGIKSPLYWYTVDTSGRRAFHAVAAVKDSIIELKNSEPNRALNGHPAAVLRGLDTLRFPLVDTVSQNATLFTVYQPFDITNENQLWHIGKKGDATIVFSTKRWIDLRDVNGNNGYKDYHGAYPKIDLHNYSLAKTEAESQYWNIATLPTKTKLPINPFSGLVAELIAYPRILSYEETVKIHTYLALKYGITFSDAAGNYVNSRNEIIWEGLSYSDYHHHIAGLARDDASGLKQLQATSMETPGEVSLKAKDTLGNQTSLIWGDNDKKWKNDDPVAGIPVFLKKRWTLAVHNSGKPLVTDIIVNTRKYDVAMPDKPVYWLLIDSTGSGEFKGENTKLIRMNDPDAKGNAIAEQVSWGNNGQTKECLALAVAGELLFTTEIKGPPCGSSNGGSIKIRIAGGQAPFRLKVLKANGQAVNEQTLTNRSAVKISNFSTGDYIVQVTDDLHQSYAQNFYINNSDAPKPLAIRDSYTLKYGDILSLHADSAMSAGTSYSWSGPNSFNQTSGSVYIKETGTYTLLCTKDGCTYRQTFRVDSPEDEISAQLKVSPNPTPGAYSAIVTLKDKMPVKLQIVASSGQVVSTETGRGLSTTYQFNGQISNNGLYILNVMSNGAVKPFKLIVVK